jgi:hypothetical protein
MDLESCVRLYTPGAHEATIQDWRLPEDPRLLFARVLGLFYVADELFGEL